LSWLHSDSHSCQGRHVFGDCTCTLAVPEYRARGRAPVVAAVVLLLQARLSAYDLSSPNDPFVVELPCFYFCRRTLQLFVSPALGVMPGVFKAR
jgi:hypothetical protein